MSWSLSQKESQSSLDSALNECGLVELAFCFDVEENHGAEQVRGETKRKAESLSRAAHFAERLFEAFVSGGKQSKRRQVVGHLSEAFATSSLAIL